MASGGVILTTSYQNYGSIDLEKELRPKGFASIIEDLGVQVQEQTAKLGTRIFSVIEKHPIKVLVGTISLGWGIGFGILYLVPHTVVDYILPAICAPVGAGFTILGVMAACNSDHERLQALTYQLELTTHDESYEKFLELLINYYKNPLKETIPAILNAFSLTTSAQWIQFRKSQYRDLEHKDWSSIWRCYLIRDLYIALDNTLTMDQIIPYFQHYEKPPTEKAIQYFKENYKDMPSIIPFGGS